MSNEICWFRSYVERLRGEQGEVAEVAADDAPVSAHGDDARDAA